MWRWVKSKDHPLPKCRVEKIANLR
jgi:hypothetical protein